MIRGGDLSPGICLVLNGQPHLVLERELVDPDKGATRIRVKTRSLKTGLAATRFIKSGDRIEKARVELVDCQYQYGDGESYVFINATSFEQFELPVAAREGRGQYLKEGETYSIVTWEGEPIDFEIPARMILTVVKSENLVRSDTISGSTKPVTTDTGLVVRVPLFIKLGERILIDTASNEYLERVGQ